MPKLETSRITARLLSEQAVADLTIEDPPIEDVIETVFASGEDDERLPERERVSE